MKKAARTLSPKDERFVAEFMVDLCQWKAMMRAHGSDDPSAKNWRQLAYQATTKPAVAAALAKAQAKALKKVEVTAERVLRERARLAFFDPRKLFDEEGRAVPVHLLDDDTAAAVAGVEIDETAIGEGAERKVLTATRKVKLADKNASLTALEKHLGMYREEGGGEGALAIHIHLN